MSEKPHQVNSLRLKGAVCGDGPYDPLATLKRYIGMNKLFMPVAPALLLKGMVDTDKDLRAMGCTYQDFVTEKFFNTGIFDMIQAKQMTTDDVQAALLQHSYNNGDNGGFTMICNSNDGFVPYTKSNAKATGASFFTTYCGSMVSEILNDKWQPCEQTIGGNWW